MSTGHLALQIADIKIAILSEAPDLKLAAHGSIRNFLVRKTRPDVVIRAGWGELNCSAVGEKVFDSGGVWRLYRGGAGHLFTFHSPAFGSRPYKAAAFNPGFTVGEVRVHRPFFQDRQWFDPLEYPLDELLVVSFLGQGGGVEVHSCGVVDEQGRGHLFVAQSGGGKSTIAGLLRNEPGISVLSDDRIVLRRRGETFWIYGTPWHGEAGLASPAGAPLTRVYFLGRGIKNELAARSQTEAVGRLFACSFPAFYDPAALDFTLGFLGAVASTVPCHELRFVPDKRVVEFIQEFHE